MKLGISALNKRFPQTGCRQSYIMESTCIQLQFLLHSQFPSRETALSGGDGQFSFSDSWHLNFFLSTNWELFFMTLAMFVLRIICGLKQK